MLSGDESSAPFHSPNPQPADGAFLSMKHVLTIKHYMRELLIIIFVHILYNIQQISYWHRLCKTRSFCVTSEVLSHNFLAKFALMVSGGSIETGSMLPMI